MSTIYRVSATERIHFSDPLHVGRFYPDIARKHPSKMRDRQDLILYLANIHTAALKSGNPLGFCRIPMRLTSLRDWVYDYKEAFERFFTVASHGYNLGEKHEISIVIPKRLDFQLAPARQLIYKPPARPLDGVVSKVYVQQHNREKILARLHASSRLDLLAPTEWLLQQPEVNFHFSPSGKLQQRDTSTWPVAAIETWPAWLREQLFGGGIDIESAYTQFLIEHVKGAYQGREDLLQRLYPDLIRSLDDKTAWRKEICCGILGLEWKEENVSIVKKVCMSLANGSRISPAILTGFSSYSTTRDIVIRETIDTSVSNLERIGTRLAQIARQYDRARKTVCTLEIGLNPSRRNQKKVFSTYFEWEREARYRIWDAVGQHGIMVHDGIDGVPSEYLQDIPGLVKSLNLRLT